MKYSKDLDEEIKNLIKSNIEKAGLQNVVEVKPFRLLKSKNIIGEAIKSNAMSDAENGEYVGVTYYEDALSEMTSEVTSMMIEDITSRISYDFEKDKINVSKGDVSISFGMWHKYGEKYINALEACLIAIDQYNERMKEEKKK